MKPLSTAPGTAISTGAKASAQPAGALTASGKPVRKNVVLAVCCLSLFLVSMDSTIVNVALPSIRADLHTGVSGQQWTLDAYTLVLASFLMLAGSSADRLGRRRTFQTGLALFTAGSVLCSLAPSIGWLIAFRAVQGLGGTMMNPVAMSIITNTFTDPRERSRAIGVWGAVVGISMAAGPLLGGLLTGAVGWRSIFWINAPIGLIAIVLAAVYVPESRSEHARRVDPVGQGLVIVALASLIFALIEAPRLGWGSPLTLAMVAAALLAVVGLLWYEPRRQEPLIDLKFFRSVPFSLAALGAVLAFLAFGSFLFLGSLYLQSGRGFSAFQTGLTLLPTAAAMALLSPVSGLLVSRSGTRLPLVLAGAGMLASALLLTGLSVSTPIWQLLLAYVLFGAGFGMVNAPITNTAVSGMPRSQAGSAAAIASTSRQIGVSLGVALSGTVVAAALAGAAAGGSAVQGARLAQATHAMWWVTALCGVCIVLLGLLSSTAWAKKSAERVGQLLGDDRAEGGSAPAAVDAGNGSA